MTLLECLRDFIVGICLIIYFPNLLDYVKDDNYMMFSNRDSS